MRKRTKIWLLLILFATAAALWWCLQGPQRIAQRQSRDDKHRYAIWAASEAAVELDAFKAHLVTSGVDGVVALDELLRSDVRWRKCGGQPFAVPPRAYWSHIVPTLRLIRDEVVPAVGPVRVVSAYRSAADNRCFGGARASRHMHFSALDLEPVRATSREDLVPKLCGLHARRGAVTAMGLGIYNRTRFHVDTSGFRRWGQDFRGMSSPCLAAPHKFS